jgi:MATE family multidrug resistance protein
MTSLRNELTTVARMSAPVVLSQLGMMLMGVVDTLMASRLGVAELAASAIANAWQWPLMSFGMGMVMGIDPLISQAHGRGDGPSTALAMQRGLVLAVAVSLPICLGMCYTREGLLLLGQEPHVAALAGRYNLSKLPVVPCFLLYSALRQYLQGRTLMSAATWVIWIANVVHVGLNWAFIFGHLGLPALGLTGAGIASSVSMAFLVLGLVFWIRLFRLHAGAWRPWDGAMFEWAGLKQAARLGLPIGLQISLETCAFALSTLMAGRLGPAALASHQIVLNLASLAFMVPLGVSQGAAARVGNLIGAEDIIGMRRAAKASLILGASVMAFSALAFTLLRFELPRLYNDDTQVVQIAAQIFPYAAAFQLFDGTQVVAGGVLRGMGRPDAAAVVNLLGYYGLALPLAYVFCFVYGHGLPGIWVCLAGGLTVVAAALLVWVARVARHPLAKLEFGAATPGAMS